MTIQQVLMRLQACLDVTEWAKSNGFDDFELRVAWNTWIQELVDAVNDYLTD